MGKPSPQTTHNNPILQAGRDAIPTNVRGIRAEELPAVIAQLAVSKATWATAGDVQVESWDDPE